MKYFNNCTKPKEFKYHDSNSCEEIYIAYTNYGFSFLMCIERSFEYTSNALLRNPHVTYTIFSNRIMPKASKIIFVRKRDVF